MSWRKETFGSLLTESRIPCENPDIERRIRVKLNVQGVEKRPVGAEKQGATKQFIRKAGQFIYGKQNFHKGAFGVIPNELDGYETSADIPSFDVREDCLPEWIYYFFKAGNRYLELTEYARGVGSQRIHPKQLKDLEIPLPPIDVQQKIISELKLLEKNEISTEISHQLSLVKQLRQAFLREAMQGCFDFAQRSLNEETGQELLEKIKAEKERLIKEKKIKKQKPLPPISEEEIPFEVPESWAWCRFNDICEIKSNLVNPDNFLDYPHIAPNNIEKNTGKLLEYKTVREDELISAKHLFFPNQLLYSKVRPKLNKVVKVDFKGLCSADMYPLKPYINADFLLWCMLSDYFLIEVDRFDNRVKMPKINQKQLAQIPVPLPPLSEQQRIVAKLDELMKYCDDLEASIKASQEQNELLLQQVLREALEPGGEKKNYKIKTGWDLEKEKQSSY